MRRLLVWKLALALVAALVVIPSGGAGAQIGDPACDVNGDGYGELVFSDPQGTVGTLEAAGVLNIRYGAPTGLPTSPDETWSQDTPGVRNQAEAGDEFGFAFTCGDFDGDGFDDLAIGVPGEGVGGIQNMGAVNVLPGSASGLTASDDKIFHQNTRGVKSQARTGERFGSAVIAGDFDGDGFDDLAIGVPNENINGIVDAGAVNVLYGSANGLRAGPDELWHQDKPGVKNAPQAEDHAGAGLAAGDFDGDGRDDLAIGVPDEDIDGIVDAGAVNVLYGSGSGLDAGPDDFWHQNAAGIKESAGTGETFGLEMTVGDFHGDGFDDLVVGVDNEDRKSRTNDGAVHVIRGTATGLTANGDQLWHQGRPGVKEKPASGDLFGEDVDANDYNGDGFDDLAIGVPGENFDGLADAGAVNVLYGSASGLSASGDQKWHQDQPGVESDAAAGETFGIGMLTDDYDGDGRADLVIANLSSPGLTFDANVLYGSGAGLSADGDQYFPFR